MKFFNESFLGYAEFYLPLLLVLLFTPLFIYAFKRATTNVRYSAEIFIPEPHMVNIITSWGWFSDKFKIEVDKLEVLYKIVRPFSGESSTKIEIDQSPIIIRWKWSSLWGDPLYIILENDGNVMTYYCREKIKPKLEKHYNSKLDDSNQCVKTKIIDHIGNGETDEISFEEYPIDNRFGSDIVILEHEISKTVSREISFEQNALDQLNISAGILDVIKSQISSEVSRQTGIKFGESLTKRHLMRFSVKPGKSVVYKILWKSKVRRGTCKMSISGTTLPIPYNAIIGLSHSVQTEPLALVS